MTYPSPEDRFSFYQYRDEIIELIKAHFPIFETVAFQPSRGGVDISYADVAVPAFLMSFADPRILAPGMERDTDIGYFLNVDINVEGYALLPRYAEDEDINPRDLNMALASCQAGTNLAALINSKAGGWACGPAVVDSVVYGVDDRYHTCKLEWHHRATVGRHDDDPFVFKEGWVSFNDQDNELILKL